MLLRVEHTSERAPAAAHLKRSLMLQPVQIAPWLGIEGALSLANLRQVHLIAAELFGELREVGHALSGPASDPCLDDFKLAIESNEVGAIARRDGSELRLEAQKCGRGARGHCEGVGNANLEQFDRIAHRLHQGQVRAGKRAIGARQAISL